MEWPISFYSNLHALPQHNCIDAVAFLDNHLLFKM